MKLINELDLSLDSLWLRKSALFSLIVELIKLQRIGLDVTKINFREFLEQLENTIIGDKNKDKTTNYYAKFYNYIYQGTFRGELISTEITKAVKGK